MKIKGGPAIKILVDGVANSTNILGGAAIPAVVSDISFGLDVKVESGSAFVAVLVDSDYVDRYGVRGGAAIQAVVVPNSQSIVRGVVLPIVAVNQLNLYGYGDYVTADYIVNQTDYVEAPVSP